MQLDVVLSHFIDGCMNVAPSSEQRLDRTPTEGRVMMWLLLCHTKKSSSSFHKVSSPNIQPQHVLHLLFDGGCKLSVAVLSNRIRE